jgi:mono/diheme cytochrome c family protein
VIGTIPGQVDLEAGNARSGKAVFTEMSDPKCSSCHTYGPAGSNAEVGPDLDTALKGKSAEFILESIVSPDAEITPGFADNLMPEDYASKLDQQQLADLVAFLRQGS